MSAPRPVVLIVLDGFGERAEKEGNAIRMARTPSLDAVFGRYPRTTMQASGRDVGLPVGLMGNSDIGHLNLGAGRIVRTDLVRIDEAIEEGSFFDNDALVGTARAAKERGGRLHVFGLVSDGEVHSSMEHLEALLRMANHEGVPVVVHAFLDGRDTPPQSAGPYLERIAAALGPADRIGTISGRYFAMDRDKRWERTERAWRAILFAEGPAFPDFRAALADAYETGQTDEFVSPRVIAGYDGVHGDRDGAIHGNYRADRARQLTFSLAEETFDGFVRPEGWPRFTRFGCMARYDEDLPLPVAYPRVHYDDVLGEILAGRKLRQLRCAETEKYAHVTYFFNGGEEDVFPGEDRVLVPSPKDVPTYDRKPEMSAPGIADQAVERIRSGAYDFVLVNFANPDMVGHTGVLQAAISAIETVDTCVGRILQATRDAGGVTLVGSDHGNCELMLDERTGGPHTAHTTNPVPLVLVDDSRRDRVLRAGRLSDVAPTILEIMGIPLPATMGGRSLIE